MKTKLLLISVFLSCATWAQTGQVADAKKECSECGKYDLIYDFKCKRFIYPDKNDAKKTVALERLQDLKITYKKEFRIKIININKYLYETTLSFEDVVLASEEPELFKKLFLGNGFNLEGIDFLDSSANGFIDPTAPTKKDDFIKALKKFKDEYNKILQKYLDAYSLCIPEANCCPDKKTDEESKFRRLSNLLFDLRLAYHEIESLVAAELEAAEAELKDAKETLKSDEAKLTKATTDKEKEKIKASIGAGELKISEMNKVLIKLKASKKEVDKFEETLDSITDDKLMEIIHFERNLIDDNFEYIVPTIYPTGDKLLLNLKIAPNTSEEAKKWQTMPLSNDEFNLDLRVRDKWFYSFSTGPFVGLSDNYRTETYGWQRQPSGGVIGDDSQYKLVSSGREGIPVGIAAFANFGTKLSDYYGIGVSIGVGATILNDTRIAYFAGVTQFFGQEKQFNLTAGISFMQVRQLNQDLYPDIGTQLYEAPVDLDYAKKFASGLFVSLSYSVFTSTNTKKATTSNAPNKPATLISAAKATKTEEATASNGTTVTKITETTPLLLNENVKKVKIKY